MLCQRQQFVRKKKRKYKKVKRLAKNKQKFRLPARRERDALQMFNKDSVAN